MKQNRHLEEYVNNKYLFVGIYAGYNKNNSRVVKKFISKMRKEM